jgi:hypothetical protein
MRCHRNLTNICQFQGKVDKIVDMHLRTGNKHFAVSDIETGNVNTAKI